MRFHQTTAASPEEPTRTFMHRGRRHNHACSNVCYMRQNGSHHIKQRSAVPSLRAGAAAVLLAGAALFLARLTAGAAHGAIAPHPQLDQLVALGALAVGTAASAVLAVGTALLAIAAIGRTLGRTWIRVEQVASIVTPRVWRQVVAAGVGTTLMGAAPAVAADDPTALGWQVTNQPAQSVSIEDTGGPTTTSALSVNTVTGSAPNALNPMPNGSHEPALGNVTVRPGDCLWSIAASHLHSTATDAEIAASWRAWYDANRDVVGADPDLILPGQLLTAPETAP